MKGYRHNALSPFLIPDYCTCNGQRFRHDTPALDLVDVTVLPGLVNQVESAGMKALLKEDQTRVSDMLIHRHIGRSSMN